MHMKLMLPVLYMVFVLLIGLIETPERVLAQQPIFELPVQLIGFPVIVLAVRISNFVKKLAYSLNPKTYVPRNKRSPVLFLSETGIDVSLAERRILEEMGPKSCVMEEPCKFHASRKTSRYGSSSDDQPDWNSILRNYNRQSLGSKQWYLLSVFLGDVMRDPQLCKQLAKRIPCGKNGQKIYVRS